MSIVYWQPRCEAKALTGTLPGLKRKSSGLCTPINPRFLNFQAPSRLQPFATVNTMSGLRSQRSTMRRTSAHLHQTGDTSAGDGDGALSDCSSLFRSSPRKKNSRPQQNGNATQHRTARFEPDNSDWEVKSWSASPARSLPVSSPDRSPHPNASPASAMVIVSSHNDTARKRKASPEPSKESTTKKKAKNRMEEMEETCQRCTIQGLFCFTQGGAPRSRACGECFKSRQACNPAGRFLAPLRGAWLAVHMAGGDTAAALAQVRRGAETLKHLDRLVEDGWLTKEQYAVIAGEELGGTLWTAAPVVAGRSAYGPVSAPAPVAEPTLPPVTEPAPVPQPEPEPPAALPPAPAPVISAPAPAPTPAGASAGRFTALETRVSMLEALVIRLAAPQL